MKINAEFDKRVVVHSANTDWIDSPMPGVSRRPLDRVGGEVARATTIVRYAPDSHFSSHVHTGGEEFVVLEGVFQDEHGDFPVGSYIRNPPQSSHTPGSEAGCVIFVKLWQFELTDSTQVNLNSNVIKPATDLDHNGSSVKCLYKDAGEQVTIQDWQANADINLDANQGIEVLVLEGSFIESGEVLNKQSWLRLPLGSTLCAKAGNEGTKVWVKQHHLNRVDREIKRIESINK